MSWIPGWGSVAATSWWSGFFLWASIVSLIGLGISEVASHRFSERKDELAAEQQEAEKKQHDDEIARLHLETAKAEAAAAQATKRQEELAHETEQLRAKNLAFEAALSPRVLEQGASIPVLSRFAGTKFVVASPDDMEAKRTAGQIRFMLVEAKWVRATEALPDIPFFQTGVTVQVNLSTPTGGIDVDLAEISAALVSQIRISNIEVSRRGMASLPRGIIRIVVGPKPLPPTLQPSIKGSGMYGNALYE
jgi:hypothetical protein